MTAIPKTNCHRDKKLLATARGQNCTMNYPHGLGHHPDTVIWAHSDSSIHGKGRNIKSHDCFGAWICANCHDILPKLPRDERVKVFAGAMKATRRDLFNFDMLVAAPEVDALKSAFDDDYWLDCWQTGKIKVK